MNKQALMAGVIAMVLAVCAISLIPDSDAVGTEGEFEASVEFPDGTSENYATLEDAVKAATDGSVVTLLKNVALPVPEWKVRIVVDDDIILDLNGKTVSWAQKSHTTDSGLALMFNISGSSVTVRGNGVVDADFSSTSYAFNINGNGSLTIENGAYYGSMTAVQVESGTFTALGGTFMQAEMITEALGDKYASYIVNCIDASFKDGTASISLKGGVYGYDFSSKPEGGDSSYVAPGHKITKNEDNTWTVSPISEEEAEASIADLHFYSVEDAFAAATDGDTIVLDKDAKVEEGAAITVPEGVDVVLDMNGKRIDVVSNEGLRPIIVNGGLKITGNGTIDSSKGSSYGIIENHGTLTIENGAFVGDYKQNGTLVKAFEDSDTVINGGTFEGSPGCLLNYGRMTINGGTFESDCCSACDGNSWAYTVRNYGGEMTIYDATVYGTQGALSTSDGFLEVFGGTFQTRHCPNDEDHNGSAFYALYVAGEAGETSCVVHGGSFEAYNRSAVLVGNSKDGGIEAKATIRILGGNFGISQDVTANIVTCDNDTLNVPDALVFGGTFDRPLANGLLAPGYVQDDDGTVSFIGDTVATIGNLSFTSLADAFANAVDGDTIVLQKSITGCDTIVLSSGAMLTFDLNGNTVEFATDRGFLLRHVFLTITGEGTLKEAEGQYNLSPLMIKTPADAKAEMEYVHLNIGPDVTTEGWAGVFVTFEDSNPNAYGVVIDIHGEVVSKIDRFGGTGHGVYVNGTIQKTDDYPAIFIHEDARIVSEGIGVYIAGYTDLNVLGGSIEGKEGGIEIRAGFLDILGGTVTCTAEEFSVVANDNGTTVTGAAVAVSQHTTKLPIDVNVSGGEFRAQMAFFESNPQDNKPFTGISIDIIGGTFTGVKGAMVIEDYGLRGLECSVTGGTFSEDVSRYLDDGYAMVGSDGSFTVGIEAPEITTQPKGTDLSEDSFEMSVTVGHPLDGAVLTYQWYRDDEPIDDAVGSIYTAEESGMYTVVVTATFNGMVSSVESTPVSVTIWSEAGDDDSTVEVEVPDSGTGPDDGPTDVSDAVGGILEAGTDTDTIEVTADTEDIRISTDTLKKAADKDITLEISGTKGSISMDPESISDILEDNPGAEDITLTVEDSDRVSSDFEDYDVFEVTIHAGEEPVTEFGGNFITVCLGALPEGIGEDEVMVFWFKLDGSLEAMFRTYVENGLVYFETDHLSTYVVGTKGMIPEPEPSPGPVFPPFIPDDPAPLPPVIIIPEDTSGDGSDPTKVAAVAAAAVVAAILAAFIIMDYRKR